MSIPQLSPAREPKAREPAFKYPLMDDMTGSTGRKLEMRAVGWLTVAHGATHGQIPDHNRRQPGVGELLVQEGQVLTERLLEEPQLDRQLGRELLEDAPVRLGGSGVPPFET